MEASWSDWVDSFYDRLEESEKGTDQTSRKCDDVDFMLVSRELSRVFDDWDSSLPGFILKSLLQNKEPLRVQTIEEHFGEQAKRAVWPWFSKGAGLPADQREKYDRIVVPQAIGHRTGQEALQLLAQDERKPQLFQQGADIAQGVEDCIDDILGGGQNWRDALYDGDGPLGGFGNGLV